MDVPSRLAFVDVETTGLRPGVDRIAEVAVVTLEGDRVERWSTVVDAFRGGHARTSARAGSAEWAHAPRFAAVAPLLAAKLHGRLVVAHNARFDHAFLRTELFAAGFAFTSPVVCSVMLSRRLSPDRPRHDLDSLARAHGLAVTVRHRALPDALLLLAWWQGVVRRMPAPLVAHALRTLLAGPLLPAALDPGVVEALPDAPGAFVMRDADGRILHTGAAGNLRTHVIDYFRLGHASGRALAIAHRVWRIEWRATASVLAARLHALTWKQARAVAPPVTLRFVPAAVPCVALAECDGAEESFGCFTSARKATHALGRLAAREGLCRCLLGLATPAEGAVTCCDAVTSAVARARALLRIFAALRPLRLMPWPHAGPIAMRVRGELLVVDRWRFVGSARASADVHALLAQRAGDFDLRTYRLLVRALARTPPACKRTLATPQEPSDEVQSRAGG